MTEKKEEKTDELSLAQVLREELNHIKRNTPPNPVAASTEKPAELSGVFKDFHNANLSALCFSGGGIRSATFGLGIMQVLAKHKLLGKFDYLSTVSGGGYLGAWLSAWILREQREEFRAKSNDAELFKKYGKPRADGLKKVQGQLNNQSIADSRCPNPEPKQLQYLREYSNYMSPKVGLLSADTWTLLGIYTRNLLLNWTIFIPLISAVLLIPRFFLTFTKLAVRHEWLVYLLLLIGLFAGSAAIAFVVNKLPSKNTDIAEIKHTTDGWVLGLGILPLLVLALAATTFWIWYKRLPIVADSSFSFLRPYFRYEAANIIIFTIVVFLLGYLLFRLFKRPEVEIDWRGIPTALVSSAVGGFLLWLVAFHPFEGDLLFESQTTQYNLLLYVCLAVPLYLLIFLIAATFFVGLSSMFVTDDDREWLARYGAWVLIISGAWLGLNGLVLFGPIGFELFFDLAASKDFSFIGYVKTSIVPLIVAVSGFLSLAGGFSGESLVRDEPTKSYLSRFLAVAPKIAAVVFLAFILVGLAFASSFLLASVGDFLNRLLENREIMIVIFLASLLVCLAYIPAIMLALLKNPTDGLALADANHLNVLFQTSIGYLLVGLIVLSALGIVMACFINVNKFSLHGAYRDRLIRAYLGASHVTRNRNRFTGFDDTDNFQLHRLKGQKPFHIINATLNLINGKNLAWQNRKAATFTMSPLHCGSWLLGYRYSNQYSRNPNLPKCTDLRYCNKFGEPCVSVGKCELPGKALRLGTAMAISGAAANPNMGYYSSSVVTFLMSLFNIRLGWWLGNTGKIGDKKDSWGEKFYSKQSPSLAVLPLLNETFGRTDENKRYLNITDGGHFENLGLYEIILRRCRLIVLSDAAADENFTFGEISNAIEKCKVDLGVDIKFNDGINIYARHKAKDFAEIRQRFAVADIIYPETDANGRNCRGYLLYIRPTIYGTESTDIANYAKSNKTFPHQSTSDQLYDEKQFEAYRALGFFTMEKIIGKQQPEDLSELMNILRDGTKKT